MHYNDNEIKISEEPIDYDVLSKKYTDEEILNLLSDKFPHLSETEMQLLEQLSIENDAESGYFDED